MCLVVLYLYFNKQAMDEKKSQAHTWDWPQDMPGSFATPYGDPCFITFTEKKKRHGC